MSSSLLIDTGKYEHYYDTSQKKKKYSVTHEKNIYPHLAIS